MGILKNLGKTALNVADALSIFPIPDLVTAAAISLDLIVMWKAYKASPTTADHAEVDDDEVYVHRVYKENPADVLARMIPGRGFSIRKSIEAYNNLDDEGKEIFALGGAALLLHFAGVYLMDRRWGRALDAANKYRTLNNRKNGALSAISSRCDWRKSDCERIIEHYQNHRDKLVEDGHLANYDNERMWIGDISYILDTASEVME